MGAKNEVIAFSLQKRYILRVQRTDREHRCRTKNYFVKNADFLGNLKTKTLIRILAHRTSKIMRVNIM